MIPSNPIAKKIALLCDMHGVRFGSAGDLGTFITALDENKHLAMDFWGVVAKSSDLDGSASANDTMLAAIVEGVTGQNATELTRYGGQFERQVKDLGRLLRGEDIRQPATTDADVQDAATSGDRAASVPTPGTFQRINVKAVMIPWLVHTESAAFKAGQGADLPESRPVFSEDLQPTGNANDSAEMGGPSSRVPDGANSDESRVASREPDLRLEPLRGYVPIEGSRLAPEPESVAAVEPKPVPTVKPEPVIPQAAPVRVDQEQRANSSSIPVPLARSEESGPVATKPPLRFQPEPLSPSPPQEQRVIGSPRLVLEPERIRPYEESGGTADRSIHVPLSGYGETDRNYGAAVLAAVLLVGVGGGAFFARTQISGLWQELKASLHSTQDAAAPAPKESGASENPASDKDAGVSPEAPARVAGERQSATLNARGENYGPGSTSKPGDTGGLADSNTGGDLNASSTLGEDAGGRPLVFPAVMEDYLESSRVPMYPEAARTKGVEGRVVMQAVIGEDGTVGHLHVLEGDPTLRNAATEAVSKWRYRPYLVDGKPVEVTTTITVNFKLNQ